MNLLEDAIVFATEMHQGQRRKGADLPFILHPLEVATIISTLTRRSEPIAAGVLHDTMEDCNVTAETLRERFGDRVTQLVQSESEDKMRSQPPEATWRLRKELSLQVLRQTDDIEVKILWLADKLSNLRSLARQYRVCGHSVWDIFHQKDPTAHRWYYEEIASCVSELSDTDAYREYISLISEIFGGA